MIITILAFKLSSNYLLQIFLREEGDKRSRAAERGETRRGKLVNKVPKMLVLRALNRNLLSLSRKTVINHQFKQKFYPTTTFSLSFSSSPDNSPVKSVVSKKKRKIVSSSEEEEIPAPKKQDIEKKSSPVVKIK